MLIRDVRIEDRRCDVRLANSRIATIGNDLAPIRGERVCNGGGGALLPGLHDHHIHLTAAAAARQSTPSGPPAVGDLDGLRAALHGAAGDGWLRGTDYHPSIGHVDRDWLDRCGPDRPIRIQHRSGRLWILNSRGMAALAMTGLVDGYLVDGDALLQERLRNDPPDLSPVGAELAQRGVTGLTDATHRNGSRDLKRFIASGLAQRLVIMGDASLDTVRPTGRVAVGAVKFHLHDHDLPPLEEMVAAIGKAHEAGRPVAAHCVTRAELLLYLAALDEVGAEPGDRIEHGGVVPLEAFGRIAEMGVTVVSQPHFLVERGEAYRREVDLCDQPWLYPLGALMRVGAPVAAGSDAPFGGIDPWRAMAAAVHRPVGFGLCGGVTPEEALALYTGRADRPGVARGAVGVGAAADLCVLDRPWTIARTDLAAVKVRLTIVGEEVIYDSMASTSPHDSADAAEMRRIESAI